MNYVERMIGLEQTIGSYEFTAEDIIQFASKYDPQPFHLDAAAAKDSVFGGLCASGWHTTAIFMKLNVAYMAQTAAAARQRGEALAEFGPSPGFENLRWLKPVFAGDTITYKRFLHGIRAMVSRPGWSMLSTSTQAYNQHGEKVLEFDNAVMAKLP